MRVVIVDADRRVRRDLAELLALSPGVTIAGAAADAAAAIALVEAERPDMVVVDPRLPSIDAGLDFVALVRRRATARIVVLCHDEALRVRAVAAGADAFLTESDSPTAVLAAIAAVPVPLAPASAGQTPAAGVTPARPGPAQA